MEAHVYLRRFGKLITLERIKRHQSGLYFFSRSNKSYTSYHTDGK